MPRGPRRRHNASVSRLKALLALIENFSRLTLVNAGATSAKWKHIVPGWVIAAGKGTSTSLGALVSTTFSSINATLVAKNPAAGVGPAFWVTDSGNYWSVTHNAVNICQTCTACGAYNSCSYCNGYGEVAVGGCSGYGQCESTSCNQWSTCDGTYCIAYSTSPATGCSAYQQVLVSGCASYSESPRTSCNSPYFYTVTTCNQYAYYYKYGYACFGYTETPVTGCSSYYTYYVTTCSSYYEYYAFQCFQYYDYFVTTCSQFQAYFYPCCIGGYSTSYYYCCLPGNAYTYYTYGCNSYAYGASAACGCASTYTYDCNCADHHRIDLSKKENGTESVISSTANSATNIAAIKVVTSGNTVTASAYSDLSLSSQVGSTLSTTNTGQKSKDHGIISKASSSGQGYTIDEFRVNHD